MVNIFSRKKLFFEILLISCLFSSCGRHKSGDENLVTLYNTNLKLASIKLFGYTTVKEIYMTRLDTAF